MPPDGAVTKNRVVNRHFLVAFPHHDLPSLMAGKVRALIVREYPKGRDWYDLLWYRSRSPRIEPNLQLLQAALDQTEGVGHHEAHRWPDLVRSKLAGHDVVRLQAVEQAIDSQTVRSGAFNVVAGHPRAKFDWQETAKTLGYQPQHNWEDV